MARCRDQLAVLKTAAKHQQEQTAGSNDELLRTAHSLAGGGGTFGFPELSERASHLETLLSEKADFDRVEVRDALDALILEIERVLK